MFSDIFLTDVSIFFVVRRHIDKRALIWGREKSIKTHTMMKNRNSKAGDALAAAFVYKAHAQPRQRHYLEADRLSDSASVCSRGATSTERSQFLLEPIFSQLSV